MSEIKLSSEALLKIKEIIERDLERFDEKAVCAVFSQLYNLAPKKEVPLSPEDKELAEFMMRL